MGESWDDLQSAQFKGEHEAWQDNLPADHIAQRMSKMPRYHAGLEMGEWHRQWAMSVLRVLKPGGYCLAFSGSRTSHWLGVGLELAGFDMRDSCYWIHAQGWPKGLNICKAIDQSLGKEPIQVGIRYEHQPIGGEHGGVYGAREGVVVDTKPATPEAARWEGWNTALKPAAEPILMARKPFDGTIAENILKWGVGGLNIDACRIPCGTRKIGITTGPGKPTVVAYGDGINSRPTVWEKDDLGRYPANLVLDADCAVELDRQSGVTTSKRDDMGVGLSDSPVYGSARPDFSSVRDHDDEGGASRFFYVPKASREERDMGLEKLPAQKITWNENFGSFQQDHNRRPIKNQHPTVKPIDIMRYLIRLVTPKGGLVLDPFLGSGTTLIACRLEGMNGIGIEKNAEYEPIIKGRITALPPDIESFDADTFSTQIPSSTGTGLVLDESTMHMPDIRPAYVEPARPRKATKQISLEGF
jgi:site-specific DNA-methyltransferase (adenine-specific)